MTGMQTKRPGTLYVVGTPIGNIGDLSPRAREVLNDVDLIAAEDTRRTRRLLSSISLDQRIIAYHEHNERVRSADLVERLRTGMDIALVSDAGMPLLSDPGWHLVNAARACGIEIRSVPGPSAITAALSVSGLPTDRFAFEGFLPRRRDRRATHLKRLDAEPRTMVFFEAVHRLEDTLAALIEQFGGERRAAIARELTKLHEQTCVGTLASLSSQLGESIPLLGEFVIAVAGREREASAEEHSIRRIFAILSRELGAEKAVVVCAEIAEVPRNTVYRLARRK